MHQHVATPKITQLPRLNSEEALSVRLIFENPSPEYGYSYLFGIRESFAKTYCRDVHVEQRDVRRGSAGTVSTIISNFYSRVDHVRQGIGPGLCVYWMIVRIAVPTDDGIPNLMPAMVCAALWDTTVVATKFDTLLTDPNDDEFHQMATCYENTRDIIPKIGGRKGRQVFAHTIVQTVFAGLQNGFAAITPQLLDTRLRGKVN